MSRTEERIQNITDLIVDRTSIYGVALCLKTRELDWCCISGNFQNNEQYFIASTTKLFVTAIILKLRFESKIFLSDRVDKYLKDSILDRLHYFDEVEYSNKITIKQLLAHTSGIPDYFQQRKPKSKSLEDELTTGNDQSWTFEQTIVWSKSMRPLFKPSQKNKAHYSDTNYQLLGNIIEILYQKDLKVVFAKEIFEPLGLNNTYLYTDPNDTIPKKIYLKNNELNIPKAMSSFKADGGIVSTSKEMMKFLVAFFNGTLFPVQYIQELREWNKIFYPLQSGIGIQRFKTPWIFSPFKSIPELIGHSGLSGAFAFYCPSKEIYLTGTVNQINKPGNSFRLMIKVLNEII